MVPCRLLRFINASLIAFSAVCGASVSILNSAHGAPLIYGTCGGYSNHVSVADAATNILIAQVPVCTSPIGVGLTPDDTKAYVSCLNSPAVSVIDVATNVVTAAVSLPGGSRSQGLAITPDGQKVYVVIQDSNAIGVISTATNTLIKTIGGLNAPYRIVMRPDGTRAYVTNHGGGASGTTVSVIDIATDTVIKHISGFNAPKNIVITPDGSKVYVSSNTLAVVKVISTATDTIVATLPLTGEAMAVKPDGTEVWVQAGGGGDISVVSTATDTTIDSLALGTGVSVFSSDGARAYGPGGAGFNVINTATNSVISTIAGLCGVTVAITRGSVPSPEGPAVFDIVLHPNPVGVGFSITLTATITDATTGGDIITSGAYTVDGSPSLNMAAQDGVFDEVGEEVVTVIPAFSQAGVHQVCVAGTDASGITGPEECSLLAVYDPEAGFVTGGGWINSPAGAYTVDPELSGKANFGFVSKYQKGANIPTGVTQFQFKVADLSFHSDNYQWLVVAGARAQYKGVGTINGGGNYGFMLTAIDGQLPGGNGVDKFRIKIWESTTEAVVYDNKLGADDFGNDATELGGGSVVIHTK